MARANPMGKLPVGQIAKRLPIGGRKRSSGLSAITKALPGGRAVGTAGGVLLGAGAAVAASRAIAGNRGGRDSDQGDQEQPKASGTGKSAKDEAKNDTKAESKSEAKDAKDAKDDAKDAGKDEQSDGKDKGKGIFGKLKNLLPGGKGGKGGKGGGKKVKVTNIIEHTDIGAPTRLVYDQWTQFQDYPSFMKKVVSVDQADDTKLNWKAKIFWSARTWESTIVEQVPDEHIVWRSKGPKGHVDGTVSFHELSPNLTRVLVVLEYHPQGLMERTGNIWRAQGRRARLELKHFRRYVMTNSLPRADEIEGWRGEIRDSEVVRTHEEALEEEEKSGKGNGSATSKDKDSGTAKGSESAKDSKDSETKDSETKGTRNGRGTRSSSSTSRGGKTDDREEEYEEAR